MKQLITTLQEQYEKYGSLIIACDFDNTVYDFEGDNSYEVDKTQELMRRCKKLGFTLICFTCRQNSEIPMQFSKEMGFEFDYFNESPIKGEYLGGDGAKPYFNILLDDKAGLEYTRPILEQFVGWVENNKLAA